MVDIKRIEMEIEALKNLSAEQYCAEEIAKIIADFEASREKKINELQRALEIFAEYQVVETAEEQNVETTEEVVETEVEE